MEYRERVQLIWWFVRELRDRLDRERLVILKRPDTVCSVRVALKWLGKTLVEVDGIDSPPPITRTSGDSEILLVDARGDERFDVYSDVKTRIVIVSNTVHKFVDSRTTIIV